MDRNYRLEKLAEEILPFRRMGFSRADEDYNFIPNRIKTPSGKILSEQDADKILEHLEFGNREQIEALKALEYLGLRKEQETIIKRQV